ncbi:MAG: pseudouridine synthase [Nonlabens sp.]
MLHRFPSDVTGIELPDRFTYPFYYLPHKLTELAASEVQNYLDQMNNWFVDLNLGSKDYPHPRGKMFGVLVVRDYEDQLGFLAAYSGIITGGGEYTYFVPPVYDSFEKNNHYMTMSLQLQSLNSQVAGLENDKKYLNLKKTLKSLKNQNTQILSLEKQRQKESQEKRRQERVKLKDQLTALEYDALQEKQKNESMRIKFMLKEYGIYLKHKVTTLVDQVASHQSRLDQLKSSRKQLSNSLQEWIFSQYKFLDATGKKKTALDIFKNKKPFFPPSGAGDCAAPKLLQFAYLNNLQPISMGEFWYGESLRSQVRKQNNFYPSCRSKCEPILNHMLNGLEVDPNPMLENPAIGKQLDIIYEDEYLIAINKPAEFLSVEGINIKDSVEYRMKKRFPRATGPMIVHRLDMSTSGIMLLTKSLKAHKALQDQFEKRTVSKRYTAILDGILPQHTGYVKLPLRVDLDNRPFQLVDQENGKPADTRFIVQENSGATTRVLFYPITGRTHQLRVHAAHPDGLNCPIVGDDLYGNRADRLYLHATQITFNHPHTGKTMTLVAPVPF